MSRILLAWELGRGYGHSSRLALLARDLARRGHEIVLALRNLSDSAFVLPPAEFRTFQTPLWIGDIGGLPPPVNFSELLIRFGFIAPSSLHGVARAWRSMIDAARPDLIVFDHAPTGLLATHGLGIPRAQFGDGFCVPPLQDPWPAFRWWTDTPTARLEDASRRVHTGVNKVLDSLGAPRLDRLSDLYRTDETFLLAFDSIDHYPHRHDTRYCGPVYGQTDVAIEPRWPLLGDRRIFAYVDPGTAYFEPLMRALQHSKAAALVFAPGVSARIASSLSSASVTISSSPYRMDCVRKTCDAAITQAGMGTASALLLAGKPQLMIPALLERGMLAKRIAELGAGILVETDPAKADYRTLVNRLLADESLATAARAFAERHADFDAHAAVARIADRCEILASGRTPNGVAT